MEREVAGDELDIKIAPYFDDDCTWDNEHFVGIYGVSDVMGAAVLFVSSLLLAVPFYSQQTIKCGHSWDSDPCTMDKKFLCDALTSEVAAHCEQLLVVNDFDSRSTELGKRITRDLSILRASFDREVVRLSRRSFRPGSDTLKERRLRAKICETLLCRLEEKLPKTIGELDGAAEEADICEEIMYPDALEPGYRFARKINKLKGQIAKISG